MPWIHATRVHQQRKDGKIIQEARTLAQKILEADPTLEKPENQILKTRLRKLEKTQTNWSRIS